jgi:hypothetical protein
MTNAGETEPAQFAKVRRTHHAFTLQVKMKDDNKKVDSAIGN